MTDLHPNLEHFVVTTHEIVRHEVRVLAPNQRVANAKAVNGEGWVTRLPQSMSTIVVNEDVVVQNIMMLESALMNLVDMCEVYEEKFSNRIAKDYPFTQSLDDLLADVIAWRESQEKTKDLATLLEDDQFKLNNTYTLWWKDYGTQDDYVRHSELPDMARRYSFDINELIRNGDVEFTDDIDDEHSEVVGGIYLNETETLLNQ
jgi:hypothetical protein